MRNLSAVIDSQLTELKQVSEKCACLAKAAEAQLRQLEDGHSAQRRVMDSLAPTAALATAWRQRAEDEVLTSDRKRVAGFRRQLDELSPAIAQLHKRCVTERHLTREWAEATRDTANSPAAAGGGGNVNAAAARDLAPAAAKAKTYVGKLKESWQHLLRDRASRTLTYNDEQFHILEKIKMQETTRVLVDLLTKECQPAVAALTDALADWYKMAQTTFLQAEILRKDINGYEDEAETFAAVGLSHSRERYDTILGEALEDAKKAKEAAEEAARDAAAAAAAAAPTPKTNGVVHGNAAAAATVASASAPSTTNGASSESKIQIRRALRTILTTQDEVWGIMNENNRLIEQFGQLAAVAAASAAASSASSAASLDHDSAQILAEIDDTLGNYGP